MRERPIRLKAHEVRAILSGAKSQTRHAVRPQPSIDASGNFCWNGINFGQDSAGRPLSQSLASQLPCSRTGRVHCPFGKIGNRLWVRETWQQVHPLQVAAGRYSHEGRAGIPGPPPVSYRTIYRADGEFPPIYMLGGEPWPYRSLTPFERNGMQSFVDDPWWNPSVHMPRWACRLVLEITDVRVDRLQAISDADATAEGIIEYDMGDRPAMYGTGYPDSDPNADSSPRGAFQKLWQSTGGDWDANPWVWVISFRRLP
ncbi:hypothetical protein [Xanthomonas arboricola]|uniref:hypothetical protein n=1 Tax=Xanthomonas arboricola TaxID=56448 RepID=UPI00118CF87D|nr:hypothetical protein [Xanthomonas arboricola]QDS15746.1 hypothetical protein FPL04_08880 [Xanthomonas arboricola]